jgi:hypothetical protein
VLIRPRSSPRFRFVTFRMRWSPRRVRPRVTWTTPETVIRRANPRWALGKPGDRARDAVAPHNRIGRVAPAVRHAGRIERRGLRRPPAKPSLAVAREVDQHRTRVSLGGLARPMPATSGPQQRRLQEVLRVSAIPRQQHRCSQQPRRRPLDELLELALLRKDRPCARVDSHVDANSGWGAKVATGAGRGATRRAWTSYS